MAAWPGGNKAVRLARVTHLPDRDNSSLIAGGNVAGGQDSMQIASKDVTSACGGNVQQGARRPEARGHLATLSDVSFVTMPCGEAVADRDVYHSHVGIPRAHVPKTNNNAPQVSVEVGPAGRVRTLSDVSFMTMTSEAVEIVAHAIAPCLHRDAREAAISDEAASYQFLDLPPAPSAELSRVLEAGCG